MSQAEQAGLIGPVFLGVLQGLTEFLPVSSSGHLVLFQQFFEIGSDHVMFDLVLHVGTLVPVLWFYRDSFVDLVRDPLVGDGPFTERPGVRLLALLAVASVPTAAMGLLFQDLFESLFARPEALVATFAITGTVLFLTRGREDGTISASGLTWRVAALLGVAQGLAITPGISRSGLTIAVALFLGLKRDFAARFSFLMSVPAILGASLFKLKDVGHAELHPDQLAAGGLAALLTGYGALVLLVFVVKRGKLDRFAWYCWFAAVAAGVIAVMTGGV